MHRRRVVVTGLGAVSPLAVGVKESWDKLLSGVSGIATVTAFDADGFPSSIAGEATAFNPLDYFQAKEVRNLDRFIQIGIVAGMEAFKSANIEVTDENADRIGVHVGSGIGGINSIERMTLLYHEKGSRRISPHYIPMSIINMVPGHLSIRYGLKGPNLSFATACTTATHAIGNAARIIEYGDADIMLAGGSESGISPTSLAGFGMARALSRRNDSPEQASRPWDVDRDGFVIGEGAGIVVLEELQHAIARGADIHAELAGFAMTADAYHITGPSPDGDGAARCMKGALDNARLNCNQIQYINAHGTSTPLGDVAEVNAIKRLFKDHAYSLTVSSVKSMIGHLLGAAGGIEAVSTVLSLSQGKLPPTINLEQQDPECDLDFVPNVAREQKIDAALSNSFGFGGTNGSIVFKRFNGS